jgi:hypothetical protein
MRIDYALDSVRQDLKLPVQLAAMPLRAQILRSPSQAGNSSATQVPESRRRLQRASTEALALSYAARGNYIKALPLYQQLAEGAWLA